MDKTITRADLTEALYENAKVIAAATKDPTPKAAARVAERQAFKAVCKAQHDLSSSSSGIADAGMKRRKLGCE